MREHDTPEIPYGYCQCGCGDKPSRGSFLPGHNNKNKPRPRPLFSDGLVRIPIPSGSGIEVAVVDASDFVVVGPHVWTLKRSHHGAVKYAQAKINGSQTMMHRLILSAAHGQIVDHIDGDGLNNRRANLRIVANSGNTRNARKRSGASLFKGVYLTNDHRRWQASITINYERIHLGTFENELDAAMAYDSALREIDPVHGRFNFPQDGELTALKEAS